VGGEQPPDDIDEPVEPLPVLAELALRPRVAGKEERDDQHHHEESHELENVPGQPAEHASREVIGDTGGGGIAVARACAEVSACLEAYRTTGKGRWRKEAWSAFNWFLGDNDLQIALYDPATGGCRDGLHPDRANENQGAESTLSFLMSLLEMRHVEENDGTGKKI